MTLTEKAAYLKGLADGNKVDDALTLKLLELVSDMADKIDALEAELETHYAYLDELDHDLGELEEEVYDLEDDFDECCCEDDDYCDCEDCDDDCDTCDCDCDCDDDEVFYEVTCPACGEKVYFDETVDPDEITCPACNAKFDCECEDDCDCCDCCGDDE